MSQEPSIDLKNESSFIEGLIAGDDAAFEYLVREHGPRLLAVARRFFNEEQDAQDAVQDAFISAFRSIGSFNRDAKLTTWMHRIVVNASLMKLRSQKRRSERSIEEFLPSFSEDGHPTKPVAHWSETVGDALDRQELSELIHRKIQELPEPYRIVLLMRDIEELDTAQTAELLELSVGAVKTRLHRARLALRGLLEPEFVQ